MGPDVVVGDDGLARCPWARGADYERYHDQEWGRLVRGEAALFERLTLEAFQAGLSWLTILRKRDGFRAAFAGFDPDAVARFDDVDRQRLLADRGIVRNRAKIDAAVSNARAVVALREHGGLERLLCSHAPPPRPAPATLADVPATTAESKALATSLRSAGFRFLGPTTAYAAMQAIGLVNDHLADCHAREAPGGR